MMSFENVILTGNGKLFVRVVQERRSECRFRSFRSKLRLLIVIFDKLALPKRDYEDTSLLHLKQAGTFVIDFSIIHYHHLGKPLINQKAFNFLIYDNIFYALETKCALLFIKHD